MHGPHGNRLLSTRHRWEGCRSIGKVKVSKFSLPLFASSQERTKNNTAPSNSYYSATRHHAPVGTGILRGETLVSPFHGNDIDNLLQPEYLANPCPTFNHLQNNDPVHWNPQLNGWMVSRYDDVLALLQDTRVSAASPF